MTRFSMLVLCILMTVSIEAQISLNTATPVTCTTITVGESLSFLNESGSGCSGIIGITSDGVTFTELTETALGSGLYEFAFASSGSYEIYCGLPPFTLPARGGNLAACVEVVDNAVPTLGEWGMISLAFLLMIFSVVAIRNTVLDVA